VAPTSYHNAFQRRTPNAPSRFTCKTKGLTVQETSRATKLSQRLVEEYHHLFDDYAITNAKFDALLKESSKH
jgi:hypothetical protein